MMTTLLETLLSHGESIPDKTAIVDREGSTTYRELARAIRAAASHLRELGVQKGDRVMITAVPFARFVAAYFACHYIGAVAAPFDKNAAGETISYMKTILATDKIFYENKLDGELNGYILSAII
jgi:acyl-CoA synthetase (AMP-forming)/AMP-acid ligase II